MSVHYDAYPTGFRIAVYSSLIKLVVRLTNCVKALNVKLSNSRTSENGSYPAAGRSTDDPRSGIPAFSILLKEEVKNIQRTAELRWKLTLAQQQSVLV